MENRKLSDKTCETIIKHAPIIYRRLKGRISYSANRTKNLEIVMNSSDEESVQIVVWDVLSRPECNPLFFDDNFHQMHRGTIRYAIKCALMRGLRRKEHGLPNRDRYMSSNFRMKLLSRSIDISDMKDQAESGLSYNDNKIEESAEIHSINKLMKKSKLTDKQTEIINRCVLGEELPAHVGASWGVSRQRADQIKSEALKKMKKVLKSDAILSKKIV